MDNPYEFKNKEEELNAVLALLQDAIKDLSKWSVYNNDLYNAEIEMLSLAVALIQDKELKREMNSIIGYPSAEELI